MVQQDEQLPDPWIVGARGDVVIDPRIVVPHRRVDRLDARRAAEHPFGVPRGRVGRRNACALGRRDVYAELGRLGLREQREAHDRHESERGYHERPSQDQRTAWPV